MRKFLLPLLLLIMPQVMFSQIQSEELQKNIKEIRWQETTGTPAYISFRDDCTMTHEQAIEYSKSFCTAENVGFTLKNQQKSKDGKIVYKYEQTIAGVPVEFSAWHIHEKNGKVTAMNGDIVDIQWLEAIFTLSESDALQAALNYIGAEVYMWMDEGEEQFLKSFYNDDAATHYPSGIKVITPVQPAGRSNEFTTAYKFNIYSKQPHDRKMVYVDAQTGEILFDLSLIHYDNVEAIANTPYCGERVINTFQNSETEYILHDITRGNGIRTFNSHKENKWPDYYTKATDFFNDDTYWNNYNDDLDQYATDAHFASISTYDYYWNIHNRNSIDDKGHQLYSYVHYDVNYFNAFWNGSFMTYGDGYGKPLTTVDICGHEITHGLTEFTAGLVYAYEPGALNEAFSDIFGTAIEFYATPEDANWLMGEKTGTTIRSMENPKKYQCPNTYKGEFWVSGGQDNGGVHTNSGVLNYWFYLLSEGGSGKNDNGNTYEVDGIGIENAEQIAFKLLTEYLTPNSQYTDAFHYAVVAACELFKDDFPEAVQAVGDAFYAVGVITNPFRPVFFGASPTTITEGDFVQFTDWSINNPTEWHWYFEGGIPAEAHNTQTPKIQYEIPGKYDVKLVVSNEFESDSVLYEKYIKVLPLPPTADFTTVDDITEIEEGETISFINLSYHYPESYSWFFEGVIPQQSSQKDPTVLYNKAGKYSVRLKTSNEGGSNVMLKEKYITVHPKTAINEHNATNGITIYPNPTDGQLHIGYEICDNEICDIKIFDVMGKNVFQLSTLNSQLSTQIDISHLPTGVYFVEIKTETGVVTKKIIKN